MTRRPEWPLYLARFHDERPGITADTLGTARSWDVDPYQWALQPLANATQVVDIACGDGPVATRTSSVGWVGVDASPAELRRARAQGAHTVVRADATRLPLPTGSTEALVCCMALMVVQPMDALLGEIRRILAPGGTAVALLPGRRPLSARDLYRYACLMAVLHRTHLGYPNDRQIARLPAACARAGLEVVDDRRLRFELPLPDEAAAHRFVASLYLPGTGGVLCRRAAQRAAQWAPGSLGLPLRRVTLEPL